MIAYHSQYDHLASSTRVFRFEAIFSIVEKELHDLVDII